MITPIASFSIMRQRPIAADDPYQWPCARLLREGRAAGLTIEGAKGHPEGKRHSARRAGRQICQGSFRQDAATTERGRAGRRGAGDRGGGREGANIACGLGGGTLGGAAIGAAVTGPLAPLGAAVGAIIGGILGAIVADEAYVKGAVPLTSGPPPFPCGQLDFREVIRSLRPDPHRDL